jgi:hypothetical protein
MGYWFDELPDLADVLLRRPPADLIDGDGERLLRLQSDGVLLPALFGGPDLEILAVGASLERAIVNLALDMLESTARTCIERCTGHPNPMPDAVRRQARALQALGTFAREAARAGEALYVWGYT